jgi:hypothetical protein
VLVIRLHSNSLYNTLTGVLTSIFTSVAVMLVVECLCQMHSNNLLTLIHLLGFLTSMLSVIADYAGGGVLVIQITQQ